MKTPPGNYRAVLLADDDADDRMLFGDAIAELELEINLQMVHDGEELMRYLLTSAVILPEILFLDLNMPFKTGFQCLEEIRAQRMLRDLFIIIYSTTATQREIDEVFRKGANLFISKPNSFTELKKMLGKLLTTDLHAEFSPPEKHRFVFR